MSVEYFLLVPKADRAEFQARTDAVKGPSDATLHYSEPIEPVDPEYPYDLWAIDDRARPVLTADEWSARLTEKPAEFRPQRVTG